MICGREVDVEENILEVERMRSQKNRLRPPLLLPARATDDRVARLAFLAPKFTNWAFLEAVGVKKNVWLFGFFFSIFGLFWRQLVHTIRLV